MAHNPNLKNYKVSRLGSIEIPINAQGVLFSHNRFRRILNPGDGLSLEERLVGDLTLFIIDCRPHTTSWRVNLLSKDDRDTFPMLINLRYRVKDSRRMIEEQITDTETLISHAIEPLLRKESRRYALHQYKQVEALMEDIINAQIFDNYGLELLDVDVVPSLSESDVERIKNLNDIDHAMGVPQQTEHDADLPTKDPAYKYRAHVIVTYRVTSIEHLPTNKLQDAEEWLWQRVKTVLRRAGRKYAVNEIDQAEASMQEAVEDEVFSDHGLEIISLQVEIDLDERARAQAEKLAQIRDEVLIGEETARAEDIKRQREMNKQKQAIEFYAPFIDLGKWRLLAMSLANNEMDAKEVFNFLDKDQREKLDNERQRLEAERAQQREERALNREQQERELRLKAELLKLAMEKDYVKETTGELFGEAVMSSVVKDIVKDEGLQLKKPEDHKVLKKGETESVTHTKAKSEVTTESPSEDETS